MFKLNNENYYSVEANQRYFSNSQYKSFRRCEARIMAEIHGDWSPAPSKAMMMGSYIDAAVEGTLEAFKAAHPEIFLKDGSRLKASYRLADEVLEAMHKQPLFMSYLEGEKQAVFTGDIAGVPFKAKLDVLHKDRIVDLKTTSSFRRVWDESQDRYNNVVSAWRYDIQGAIYQELVRQASGKKLPFYLAIVTREAIPDFRLVHVDQWILDNALKEIQLDVGRYQAIKYRLTKPTRCERCDYCKSTRVITEPVMLSDLDSDMNVIKEGVVNG